MRWQPRWQGLEGMCQAVGPAVDDDRVESRSKNQGARSMKQGGCTLVKDFRIFDDQEDTRTSSAPF